LEVIAVHVNRVRQWAPRAAQTGKRGTGTSKPIRNRNAFRSKN
jgi:hypothetical protein